MQFEENETLVPDFPEPVPPEEFDNERELDDERYMRLSEDFIVLAIPDDTVEVDITAKIYVDHELHEVTKHMDFPEVRAAIREARQGYIPSEALFSLRKTGQEKIKELLDRYIHDTEE